MNAAAVPLMSSGDSETCLLGHNPLIPSFGRYCFGAMSGLHILSIKVPSFNFSQMNNNTEMHFLVFQHS